MTIGIDLPDTRWFTGCNPLNVRPVFLAAMAAILLFLTCEYAAAAPSTPAVISLSNTIAVEQIEPLGANMSTLAGGTNLLTNNLIWGSGMEPAVARYLIRVERSGPGWIEWDQSSGGVHMWDQNATGFGDGANVRLYRIVDSSGQALSYSNGTDMSDATGADRVIFLGETTVPVGGWVADGSNGPVNRVSLANTALLPEYGDHAIITVTKNRLTSSEVHTRLHQWFNPDVNIMSASSSGVTMDLVAHPGILPAQFTEPGETCLKVVAPSGGGWCGQWLFHGHDQGEGQWYTQLEPGALYRAEVWLRQENIPNGEVRFYAAGPYSSLTQQAPWSVTGQWQRFTYDFTGPAYPNPASYHAALGIQMMDQGTLWLDNFMVYRYDAAHDFKPFTPNRVSFDEMMSVMPSRGSKPALRFYNTTYAGHSPMKRLLSNYASSHINFIYNVGAAHGQVATIPHVMNWALATGISPSNRIIPYITLSEEYTEVEWLQLAEYLGVPYDPAIDTPASKPWAYLRYQQRGQGTPWTDEFREIVIELGNETWHAGVFAGWHGFGRPNWVHHGGREYGLFADYYFNRMVAAQSWWSENHLDQKIKFALGANYDGSPDAYGELAAQNAPDVTSYLGHANYVGPKWETGEVPFQSFDDHGMQETLVGAYLTMFPLIEEVAATRDQLKAGGLADYRPIAYEGGPSGYYLPGNGTPEQVAISQQYGKSLGMAVSAMDAWLYCSLNGYAHQEYFAFACGGNWTSHTMPRAGGFRPHPGWLALKMRNLYAPGTRMLETAFQSIPTYTREGQEIPLISAYAVQGSGSTALFILSRKVDGVHDGADFGDGTTPVTVTLPFTKCKTLTRYALTAPDGSPADPRDNNITTQTVAITSVNLDPNVIRQGVLSIDPDTGGITGGMPPGTLYLYVFEFNRGIAGFPANLLLLD